MRFSGSFDVLSNSFNNVNSALIALWVYKRGASYVTRGFTELLDKNNVDLPELFQSLELDGHVVSDTKLSSLIDRALKHRSLHDIRVLLNQYVFVLRSFNTPSHIPSTLHFP